jgi:hypothetical protein
MHARVYQCRSICQAVERCAILSSEGTVAANVKQLFHSSTVQRANTGCLLEQVPSSARRACQHERRGSCSWMLRGNASLKR